jgi:hypothetical protein
LATYWSPNGGEFEDAYQYLTWLSAEATHPATAARIKLLGVAMQEDANKYFPGLPASDPQVQAARQAAADMIEVAERIERYTSFPEFFSGALKTDLTTLALAKRAQ